MRRDKLFGNMFMRLSACAAMAFVCAGSAWGKGINPAYKKWVRQRHISIESMPNPESREKTDVRKRTLLATAPSPTDEESLILTNRLGITASNENFGFVPPLIEFSNLSIANVRSSRLNASESLRRKYDSRDKGWITTVKDQNPFGTCWAHAAIGAAETAVRMKNPDDYVSDSQPDFSENNMVMQTKRDFHPYAVDDYGDPIDEYSAGGHFETAFAYLGRWGGPILETQDTYPSASNNYSTRGNNVQKKAAYHVNGYLQYAPKVSPLDHDEIKRAIMKYGGVWVSYCATEEIYYNQTDGKLYTYEEAIAFLEAGGEGKFLRVPFISEDRKSFYNCATKLGHAKLGSNHAVLLIGWDDDYSKEDFSYHPNGDGAYLIKNSWGTNQFDNGCLWVSYYDDNMLYDNSYAIPAIEKANDSSGIYQHDDSVGLVYQFPNADYRWGANVFTATNETTLTSVGFYSLSPTMTYTLQVYTGVSANNPVSGTCQTGDGMKGKVPYAGFVTIKLDNPVPLSNGERFSVVLNLEGCEEPFGTEVNLVYKTDWWSFFQKNYKLKIEKFSYSLTSKATAEAGQSFMSKTGANGTWQDIVTDMSPICVEKEGFFLRIRGQDIYDEILYDTSSANLCIKAYTQSKLVKTELTGVEIKGGETSVASGGTVTLSCTALYNNIPSKDVTSSAEWAIVTGKGDDIAEVLSPGVVKTSSVFETRIVSVLATYKEDGMSKSDTWDFYVTAAAPESPTNATATQGAEASCVRVNWAASSGATEYAVYRAVANNSKNAQCLENVTVAKYNDTSAVPGVDYWYFVKAKNSSGASGYSIGASGWRKLSPPESVTASDSLLDRVALEWSEVDGAAYYRVYRAESIDGAKSAISDWQTAITFDDTTATAGVTYFYFVVAAVDASGSRPSDYSIVEDGIRPEPVTIDYLAIKGDASIASGGYADYTADSIYTDRHRVENVSPVTWTVSGDGATVSGNRVTAATVTENKKVVLLASYTEDGEIARGEKQITIAAVKPNTPTGVTAGLVSQGVTITWSAVSGAVSYKVYRADSANAVATQIGMTAGTSYPDTSAMPGVAYTYSVSAVNGAGESERSGGVVVTVPFAVPTGVTASSDRTDGVLVSWQTVNGASYYRVARAMSATGAKTDLGSWQTGTSYLDTSATAGTMYWYFVRAATSSGGANASGYSASAQGVRKVPVTLSSISISGPDKVSASKTAMYTCTATYSDGTSKSVSPTWSVSGAATIDANGKLTANAVSANSTATVVASFTDGTTKTANKAVTVIAPIRATADVRNINVASRWPFSSLLDIDYELVTDPASAKAMVNVIGRDEDHNVDMAAKTLSGDGANGSYIAAGQHRLTWNIGADYTNFHAKAFSVTMTAAPSIVGVPENVTVSASTSGVTLNWSAVEDATGYEVWRGTGTTTNGATKIATVTGATTYFDGTGTAGTTYRYWLRASGEDGMGEFSQPVTGTSTVIVPTSLVVSGASSVTAGGTATYSCTVTRNDGTSGTVTPTWSITSGSSYASISSSGVLTAYGTATQRSVTIQASYTQNGTTKTATKSVTINTKSVTIYFNGNGGTASTSSRSYTAYGTYGSLPTATRSGYTFAGWWTASSGGTQVTTSSTVPSAGTTLYAHWTAISSFGLVFDDALRNYAAFEAWPCALYLGVTNTLDSVEAKSFTPGSNVYIHFAWQNIGLNIVSNPTVKLEVFSSTMSLVATASATSNIELESGYATYITGWTWGGIRNLSHGSYILKLTLDPDCLIEDVDREDNVLTYGFNVDATGLEYGVILDQQGGSGGTTSIAAVYGSAMPTITVPTRTGYAFGGYYTAASGSGTQYYSSSGASARAWDKTSDTTLYAKWTANSYVLSVNPNGGALVGSNFGTAEGTGQQTSVNVTYDALYYYELGTATRSGYTFDGWWTSAAGGEKVYGANGLAVTGSRYWNTSWQWQYPGSLTIYAHWTSAGNTVTLNKQSGNGGTSSVTATYGSAMPSITVPTRTGYAFGGYYTGTNGSGTQYYTASGTSARTWDKTSDTTLYAKWTASTCTVTLNKQSGSGGTSSVTATYGSSMPSITVPTRSGYTFGGYYTDMNGSGTQYYTATGASARTWDKTSATTLYAQWTVPTYTITLNKQNGGGGSTTVYATYGSAMPSITIPTRTGYSFGGYYTGTNGSGTQYYTASGASARTWDKKAATTLYAKWIEAKYIVIDLSNGSNASSYPVSYLDSEPSGGWDDTYKTSKLVLRLIPSGLFVMGTRSTDYSGATDGTLRSVTISKPFYIGVFEVTQRQWELVMGTRPSLYYNDSYYSTRPVEHVTYEMIRGISYGSQWPSSSSVDSTSFMGKIRSRTGLTALDLPTEAEWEYACRAGTTTALNSGKNLTSDYGSCANLSAVGRNWYNQAQKNGRDVTTASGTNKVGCYTPNSWGLYDMHGNVSEWCLDWSGTHSSDSVIDPKGASSGSYRVTKGGSCECSPLYCRSGFRTSIEPASLNGATDVGLRLSLR